MSTNRCFYLSDGAIVCVHDTTRYAYALAALSGLYPYGYSIACQFVCGDPEGCHFLSPPVTSMPVVYVLDRDGFIDWVCGPFNSYNELNEYLATQYPSTTLSKYTIAYRLATGGPIHVIDIETDSCGSVRTEHYHELSDMSIALQLEPHVVA